MAACALTANPLELMPPDLSWHTVSKPITSKLIEPADGSYSILNYQGILGVWGVTISSVYAVDFFCKVQCWFIDFYEFGFFIKF